MSLSINVENEKYEVRVTMNDMVPLGDLERLLAKIQASIDNVTIKVVQNKTFFQSLPVGSIVALEGAWPRMKGDENSWFNSNGMNFTDEGMVSRTRVREVLRRGWHDEEGG